MNFPNYFADADSSFEEAEFVIFGVPYDKTSSFRKGAEKAPNAIREASWNFETYDFKTGVDLKDIRFHDYGNLKLHNYEPKEMIKKVRKTTHELLQKNKIPITLGGEHSITVGVNQAFPVDIAVLSLDAHLDFRDKYENEMFNHACVSKRIVDHRGLNNLALLGVRSAEKKEFEDAEKKGLFYFDSYIIREKGIKKILEELNNYFGNKQIYITLDIDVLDPAYAPGNSTPEPFGLKPLDVIKCIEYFSSKIVGFDIVEVCPLYDKGETALMAAKFARYTIGSIWKNQKI